jgi:hypothetical protein
MTVLLEQEIPTNMTNTNTNREGVRGSLHRLFRSSLLALGVGALGLISLGGCTDGQARAGETSQASKTKTARTRPVSSSPGAPPETRDRKLRNDADGLRCALGARVGDFVTFRFKTLLERMGGDPKPHEQTRGILRIEVLSAGDSLELGVRVESYERKTRRGAGSWETSTEVSPAYALLQKGVVVSAKPTRRQGSASGSEMPGFKITETTYEAAGVRWKASQHSRDDRPSDGSLKQLWSTALIGSLYLSGGVLKSSCTYAGFGSSGGYQLELLGLGTKRSKAAFASRVVSAEAWQVDPKAKVGEIQRVRRPIAAELRVLTWPGMPAPLAALLQAVGEGKVSKR